jgi:uncharacterized protein (DUF2126 family)
MGGEPTFVSARDRDGAEWNTDALGPTKRGWPPTGAQAARTLWRGGFLHFGQGKWYPGEQLPRWALSICWRADGQPCWQTRRCSPTNARPNTTPRPMRSASCRR